MNAEQETAYRFLTERPAEFGNMLGYSLLTDLHNGWIRDFVLRRDDWTLQAHRGSYKTTAGNVGLTIRMMLKPAENMMFIRKTDTDVKPVMKQVKKNLQSPVARTLYHRLTGAELKLVTATSTEITTSGYRGVSGSAQLTGIGTKSSITGKHADFVWTDDIVNLDDRRSRAEREATKGFYHELHNVVNRDGSLFNSGTPWHKDDAFTLMPAPRKFDCYTTGLMTPDQVDRIRAQMPPSLFAANYELMHIASERALFTAPPRFTEDASLLRDGIAHIDAAYGGEDYTALTCARRRGDTIYMFGRLWHAHVDTVLDAALTECDRLMCAPIYCETNGDKGYLAREIVSRGARAGAYTERQNKYFKISNALHKWWGAIVFLAGTDRDYINQIMDYTEDAEHDDAPDSAASIVRYLDTQKQRDGD